MEEDERDGGGTKAVYVTRTSGRSREARALLGFCDTLDGFCIDRYPLDEDQWTEGYFTVA